MLFVPAHKKEWIEKASSYGTDAIILDLEDSVPAAAKDRARAIVREEAPKLSSGLKVFVRINKWDSGHLVDDLISVVSPYLTGLVLPKVSDPADVAALDRLIGDLENGRNLDHGSIEIVPLIETAQGVEQAYEVFTASKRVERAYAISGLTPGFAGDLHQSLGVTATESGFELDPISSRVLVAARAAGIEHILGGMSVAVDDAALLSTSLRRSKWLGASGSFAIHPAQIPVIHEVFTPTDVEVADAVEILVCLRDAAAAGDAAARFRGVMVDIAHARSALALLDRAARCGGLRVPDLRLPPEWTPS